MTQRINELFFTRPWAVRDDVLTVMADIVRRHMNGEKLTALQIQAATEKPGKKEKRDLEIVDGTAVVPIYGIIAKRMNMVNRISSPQGTATEAIKADIRAALDDPQVNRILLDIDSPGGSIGGVDELSDFIFMARKQKPVIAFANGQMDSAAYWIGSAAEKIYAEKTAEVGSIGVYSVVEDWSVADHQMGVKTEIIKAGKHKADGHPSKPLTEEGRANIQNEINTYYDLFVAAVSRNRNISLEETLKLADGRVWIGQKAVDAGLIDGIKSFEEFFAGSPATAKKVNADTQGTIQAKEITPGSEIDGQGGQEKTVVKETLKQEEVMAIELTVAQVKTDHKAIADALVAEGKGLGLEEGKVSAQAAEKARISAIRAAMPKGMEVLALDAIEKGSSVEATKDSFLGAFKAEAPKTPGPNAEDPTKTAKTHMERAKEYQAVHKCSIGDALSATAERRK